MHDNNFYQISGWMVSMGLKNAELPIFAIIFASSQMTGTCTIDLKYIAKLSASSVPTVKKAIQSLVDKGVLEVMDNIAKITVNQSNSTPLAPSLIEPKQQIIALSQVENPAYEEFTQWMRTNTPRVMSLKEPISEPQFCSLQQQYSHCWGLLLDTLCDMHNYQPLLKSYTSANLTLRKWLNKRTESNGTSSQYNRTDCRQGQINELKHHVVEQFNRNNNPHQQRSAGVSPDILPF